MSEELKKYIVSRLGESYVLLQEHPTSGRKVCVIKKKDGNAIDARFMEAVQQQATASKIRFNDSDSSLRLEADTEDHFNFLLKC